MERKMVSIIMLTLLLISMVSILLTRISVAEASPITVLSVSPTSIVDPTLGTGSIFRIDITVADVQQLAGFQFILNYDTTVLTAIDYGFYPPLDDPAPSEINDASGYVALSATLHIEDWESGGLTTVDPESIAWIEFIVDDIGISVLDLHGPYNGSLLGNIYANPIPHEDVDGFFENRLQVVMAITDIDSDTLNLRSRGRWIIAYIELLEGYYVNDINASSLWLNSTIPMASDAPMTVGDHDSDTVPDLMVKFDRAMVQSFIYNQGIRYGNVALTITGKLFDGTPFEGTDTIFVNQ